MKKIIALITALLLVFNLCAFTVSAADLTITSVYLGTKDKYEVDDEVKITGTCTPGEDIVIRIYNENDGLIYTDVILAPDNTTGTFEFTGFQIPPKEVSKDTTLTYKVIVSGTNTDGNDNDVDIAEAEMKVFYEEEGGGGGGGGGSDNTMSSWIKDEPKKPEDVTPEDPNAPGDPNKNDPAKDASKDSLNTEVIEDSSNVTSTSSAVKLINDATKGTPEAAMAWESTRNTIAVSVETMIANVGSKRVSISGSTNKLVLKETSISDSDLKKYTDTEKTLKDAVNKNKITLNRELAKEYIVNTSFVTTKKANITIYKGFVTKLETVGIETLTINDKNFRVSYNLAELKKMIGDTDFTSFDIDTTREYNQTKKLTVNFDTDKTQTVKISFPGLKDDAKYMAIVDENGNPVGGRYNPATGAIEAKISESGVYQIVNNEKDFDDIKHLSQEMQESIKILASKGIIEGTAERQFSPEDTISRAEVAALLLRVLSQVDPNADGGFTDVKKSDWFYGTAGSAKAYGMIAGYTDNTFRGNVTIAKDQILAIASRVLQKEMKYKVPEKPEEWLKFSDTSSIAAWAQNDIALATMANIITRSADNTIHATENMTRGDAALIIMRLFYKIW